MTTSTPPAQPTNTQANRPLTGPYWRYLFYGLLAILSLVALFTLKTRLDFFFAQVGQRLAYPYFQTGSEGLILSEAAIIHAGGSIYMPFQAGTFISAPYPPFYYYLLSWLWPSNPSNLFETGRWISLLSALLTALLIAGIALLSHTTAFTRRNWPLPALLALISGAAFLSLPAVTVWAVRVRADMLMTALQLAGLFLVALGVRTRREAWLWLALLPFSLALFTKQTALAAPLASVAYLGFWYGRRWQKWVSWVIGLVASVAVPFLIINLASGNEFYRRIFKYHSLPWQFNNFTNYLSLFISENAGLLILGASLLLLSLGVIWQTFRTSKGQKWWERGLAAGQAVPLVVWFWLAGLVSLVSLGVAGADHNHFLPIEAADSVVAGTLALRLWTWGKGRWLTLLALAGLSVQFIFFSVPAARYEIEFRYRDVSYQAQLGHIIDYLKTEPGPILSSEAGFFVLTGKNDPTNDYYNDLFTMAALDRQGLYSEDGLLDRIRRKEFSAVVAEGDLFNAEGRPDVWTPQIVQALQENYYLKFKDIWCIYEPKN